MKKNNWIFVGVFLGYAGLLAPACGHARKNTEQSDQPSLAQQLALMGGAGSALGAASALGLSQAPQHLSSEQRLDSIRRTLQPQNANTLYLLEDSPLVTSDPVLTQIEGAPVVPPSIKQGKEIAQEANTLFQLEAPPKVDLLKDSPLVTSDLLNPPPLSALGNTPVLTQIEGAPVVPPSIKQGEERAQEAESSRKNISAEELQQVKLRPTAVRQTTVNAKPKLTVIEETPAMTKLRQALQKRHAAFNQKPQKKKKNSDDDSGTSSDEDSAEEEAAGEGEQAAENIARTEEKAAQEGEQDTENIAITVGKALE